MTILRFKNLQSTAGKASSGPGLLTVAHYGLAHRVGAACVLRAGQQHPWSLPTGCQQHIPCAPDHPSQQKVSPDSASVAWGQPSPTGEPLGNTTGFSIAQQRSPVCRNTAGNQRRTTFFIRQKGKLCISPYASLMGLEGDGMESGKHYGGSSKS